MKSKLDPICMGSGPAPAAALLLCLSFPLPMAANPTGGTVSQGAASFSTSGSTLTIQTSDRAYINWQSFNIGQGETTTFVQPSSSSLVWNQINDPNPSQILGTLNANGYVVLQNQNGFYIGGQAAINTGGLIMTTAAPNQTPDLVSGGPWAFTAPPPTASIINFGQVSIGNGGSAFLIANNIENQGAISAPQGNIGLHAGQEVLVSERPDGRGLSAVVTLPQGSVDNAGKLIADAGTIALNAQVVNQGGLIQANSIQEQNGVIELVASDTLNLGASSVISAKGDSQGTSPGGNVTLQAGNQYGDNAGSVINFSGGAQGGNGGSLEISAPSFANGMQSVLLGSAAFGWPGGSFILDPDYIQLVAGSGSSGSGTSLADPMKEGVNLFAGMSQISIPAGQDIELSTAWTLPAAAVPSTLNLTAGNSITLDDSTDIKAGKNWNVSMSAGPLNLAARPGNDPDTGQPLDSIFLNGSAFIQTQNGNINLWAANDVLVNDGLSGVGVGNNGITTAAGGNVTVTAQIGDVNSGGNPSGYVFSDQINSAGLFYKVSKQLGGISTAAGGNVTINAGGDVTSYLPSGNSTTAASDGGTGAFGPEPGNVTITAGGNVYGHYVLADGVGTITAGGNFGDSGGNSPFALSLVSGTWNINAPNGSIYLQEVRNPNGVFNNVAGYSGGPGQFLFDYDPQSAVNLTAGVGVALTGQDVPRLNNEPVPVIYPPTLNITAGSGGVAVENSVILFPSAYGNLNITTTDGGNLIGAPTGDNETTELQMSDSAQTQWQGAEAAIPTFGETDNGNPNLELNNPNPVLIDISGDMENVRLFTTKETQINVAGDIIDASFSGQNLHASDVTSINVGGQIFDASPYTFIYLNQPIPSIPAADLPPGAASAWDTIFGLLVNAQAIADFTIPAGTLPSQYNGLVPLGDYVFGQKASSATISDVGFDYNPATGQLGFEGPMPSGTLAAFINPLTGQPQPLTVLEYQNGIPVTYTGTDGNLHFKTDTINWVPPAEIQTLATDSQSAPSPVNPTPGLNIAGPGALNINAGSIELGNALGILSYYGTTLNVTTAGDLDMLTSTIAALGSGDVNVTSGGSIDLGSQDLFSPNESTRSLGFGVFSSGGGNVSVIAQGDVNVDGSRIATYNGGNILVESYDGNVNAGIGGDSYSQIQVVYVSPVTKQAGSYQEGVAGSGILANTLIDPSQVPDGATQEGNITVLTPKGDIVTSEGGIVQEALTGNVSAGPVITLSAGSTVGNTTYIGNIDLGISGVLGGAVNATATGNISGLVISRQTSTIVAQQSFTGTVLSGGEANVTAVTGSVSGEIVGVGGANVSGAQGVTADVLSQSANVNGATSSTLGTTATASAASQSAAGTASTDTKTEVSSSQSDDASKTNALPLLARLVKRVRVILPN